MRINSITQVGGVNSIANFASSWQRAVGFHEITPVRASFILAGDDDLAGDRRAHDDTVTQATRHGQERGDLPVTGGYPYHTHHKSLLRQQLLAEGTSPESLVVEGSAEGGPSHTAWENTVLISSPSREQGDIFRHASHLATPYGSYSSTYGSLSAPLNQSSKSHAAQLYQEQQLHGTQEPGKEQEPLLMKRVEEDGKVILTVIGQSTLYQTVLNSTNVLIGVGLLTLPLGIKYAGWVVGLAFLTFSAIITKYTARQLGKCLDLDRSLITFADLAYISFGSGAQISIGILFTLELTAACVALFVLFGDSLDLLFPGWGVTEFKILLGIIMIPLSFVPLRLLGYTSSLGITCCLGGELEHPFVISSSIDC
jgi:vesicular inhibitory amino acid transporter